MKPNSIFAALSSILLLIEQGGLIMNKHKLDRFSFLSEKINSSRATPREVSEYYMLLDEWNDHSKSDVFENYFLNSNKDNSSDI